MKKRSVELILASRSKHRQKLLRRLGLPFRVVPSQAQELSAHKKGFAHLVKANALLKARDVARRVKAGLVLGSDTLVFTHDKKVVGKPRTLAEAKKNLKALMKAPHWLYTGVALIDVATGKTLVDHEKTKIFMSRLSDQEINDYYRAMRPHDKAGGFDIEGKGAFFIPRIEGCYFNVVGLPMAKVRTMLKKFGVSVFCLLCAVYVSGCMTTEYNLATRQEETLLFNTDKEVSIGNSLAQYVEKENDLSADPEANHRVSVIARRIEEVCDRAELVYAVQVIDKDEVNAFALPGGYIYVYKGLVDKVANDDELAGVIAHEFGHITAKHAMKRLQGIYGYTFLQLLAVTSGNANLARGIDLAFLSILTGYSQEDELMADKLAVKYMQKAGYDPAAMESFLQKLQEINAKEPPRPYSYFKTHPGTSQRVSTVHQAITGEMDFRDYIRTTREEESF